MKKLNFVIFHNDLNIKDSNQINEYFSDVKYIKLNTYSPIHTQIYHGLQNIDKNNNCIVIIKDENFNDNLEFVLWNSKNICDLSPGYIFNKKYDSEYKSHIYEYDFFIVSYESINEITENFRILSQLPTISPKFAKYILYKITNKNLVSSFESIS